MSSLEPESRYERLLEQYELLLRAVIRRHCPPSLGIDVHDVEQDARLRLWKLVEREKELDDPASYLYRIAVTTTIDAVRRVLARKEEQLPDGESAQGEASRELSGMVTDPNEAPDAVAQRRELMMKVRAALATLIRNRRRAVELHLQGLTLGEIAHLTGWSEGKTRNLVYRGLSDLRVKLRQEGIDTQ